MTNSKRDPLLDALEALLGKAASHDERERRISDLAEELLKLCNEFIAGDSKNNQKHVLAALLDATATTLSQVANHDLRYLLTLRDAAANQLELQAVQYFIAHHCHVHHKGDRHDS